jgi:hypothetical protein
MVSGAVSVQPPLGDIPCYFRLSAQVRAAVEQSRFINPEYSQQ